MSELDLGGLVATRLLLHIGTQKSGTTYLQRVLERLAVKIRDQGVLYPIRLAGKKEIYNHESASYGLLGRDHYPWVPQVRADAERPAWDVLVKKVREWPGTAIVSGEAISVVRRIGAEQLVSSLNVADTQIIITARDLGRVIPSSWQQHIRNGRSSKMSAYIQTLANKRRGDLDADEALWESDPDLTFWRAYAIGSLVKRWQSVVGPDRVTVVTVPGREAGPDALWLRFREGLRLSEALPTNPPKVDMLTANVGLTEAEVNDTERMLHFVGLMLDQGFIPVSSPYADPPSAPWPEQGNAAVLRRLRREWEALDHDVTFLDLCWFHRP
jgi:hypothetical protein